MKLFLGFDFYGAGNIGDDLMLAGLLNAMMERFPIKLFCIIPRNISSQAYRFPQVEWMPYSQVNRAAIIAHCDCWLGVGGTPFQMRNGPWFLKKILNDINAIDGRGLKMYMLGVGAETEILGTKDMANHIVRSMEHIWTRDRFTHDFLIENFYLDGEKVTIGSDLANIALKEIFSETNPISNRQYELAITYYNELLQKKEIKQLRKFIRYIGNNKSVVFVANETRKNRYYEYGIYRSMFGGVKKLSKKPFVDYYVPNYKKNKLIKLVNHFQNYKVVMASRYHTLLAAAWAGCSLVALARSAKIEALANELKIPLLTGPLTSETLYNGFEKAKYVSRETLKEMALRAQKAVHTFLNHIKFE